MKSVDMIVTVKTDIEPCLAQMRELAARMEAAAAQMPPAVLGEGEFATATLKPMASELPVLGSVASALVAGAVLAGSTTKRLSRRALLGLHFFRKDRR